MVTVKSNLRRVLRVLTGNIRSSEEQEMRYLRPLLKKLSGEWRVAVDVGANIGNISRSLAQQGFTVYALEPYPPTREALVRSLADQIKARNVCVLGIAASDRDGIAEMYIGTADTVNTLETDWTAVAFPEYFGNKQTVQVETRQLANLLSEQGVQQVGFLKIDVEGHEINVLKGTLDGSADWRLYPRIIMFEANQRFPARAEECLALLAAHDYPLFDMFIKAGTDLLSTARFAGSDLPEEWHRWQQDKEKYFYANIIAYHASYLKNSVLPELPRVNR